MPENRKGLKEVGPVWHLWFRLLLEDKIDWRDVKDSRRKPVNGKPMAILFGVPGSEGGRVLEEAILQARIKTLYHHSGLTPEEVNLVLKGDTRGLTLPPPLPDKVEKAVGEMIMKEVVEAFRTMCG
jgi:hypothetical protein